MELQSAIVDQYGQCRFSSVVTEAPKWSPCRKTARYSSRIFLVQLVRGEFYGQCGLDIREQLVAAERRKQSCCDGATYGARRDAGSGGKRRGRFSGSLNPLADKRHHDRVHSR